MILNSSGQNIYPEEVEAVLANNHYVDESVVVDREGKIVALVYSEQLENMNDEERAEIVNTIRVEANKSLPIARLQRWNSSTARLRKHPR